MQREGEPRGATPGGTVALVIPARYASTRLPGKPLLQVNGKFLLEYVWEQACRSTLASKVVVATDDERIWTAARGFGAHVEMTAAAHQSGTDRIAQLVREGKIEADIIVNVQGDEPEIEPESIDAAARLLLEDELADIGTLVTPVKSMAEYENPNAVKAVLTRGGYALYFSRAKVPYVRDGFGAAGETPWPDKAGRGTQDVSGVGETGEPDFEGLGIYRHLGLYSYRREALLAFAGAAQTRLEKLEKLEQLRAIEMGLKIKAAVTRHAPAGIDTPEDFRAFVERRQGTGG